MTEEQLLGAMQKTRSNHNGAAPAHTNGHVVYNNGIGPARPTIRSTPGARRMALKLGHDLSRIKGTGEAGVILHRDVLNYVPTGRSAQSRAAAVALPGATGEAQLVTRRGRQRTPKPWMMAVLCRFGMHEGQWAYVAEGNCTQGRECGRCGVIQVRTKHQREWQYVGEHTCKEIRTCRRCNATNGERTIHEKWSESWDVGGDESAHRCLRCGTVETWSTVDYGD